MAKNEKKLKYCRGCKNNLPIKMFLLNGKDAKFSYCEDCRTPEKIKERKKRQKLERAKNRKHPTERRCKKCTRVKSIGDFRYDKGKNAYAYSCEVCLAKYRKDKYLLKKESSNGKLLNDKVGKASFYREKNRHYLSYYKIFNNCAHCSETDPEKLQFDHRNPKDKKFNISAAISKKMSLKNIDKEIQKCTILCGNCHKKVTAKDRDTYRWNRQFVDEVDLSKKESYKRKNSIKRWRERQEFIWSFLLENPCSECGESDPVVLEFDHIDPKNKDFTINKMLQCKPIEEIKKELSKCRVLCVNCHLKVSKSQIKERKTADIGDYDPTDTIVKHLQKVHAGEISHSDKTYSSRICSNCQQEKPIEKFLHDSVRNQFSKQCVDCKPLESYDKKDRTIFDLRDLGGVKLKNLVEKEDLSSDLPKVPTVDFVLKNSSIIKKLHTTNQNNGTISTETLCSNNSEKDDTAPTLQKTIK